MYKRNLSPIAQRLLNACKKHVGEWCCTSCSINSGQPAAVIRDIKSFGYEFEKSSPTRCGKSIYCPHCDRITTHYKLISTEPTQQTSPLANFTPKEKMRVISVLGNIDAMSGKSTRNPVIDHKTPYPRNKKYDYDILSMSDDEIKDNFQILSFANNLVKANACKKCVNYNIRQKLFGISYFTKGNESYEGTCEGCGYHDCTKWRNEVNELLN